MVKQMKTETRRKKPVRGLDALAEVLMQMKQETPSKPEQPHTNYNEIRNPTHNVISTFAFLIGIDRRHFENPVEPPQMTVYEEMTKHEDARVFRGLCMLRTAMEQNYMDIVRAFQYDLKNLSSLPELIPQEAVTELTNAGIRLFSNKPNIDNYLITVNIEISNRIHGMAAYFPEWAKWDYIKPLFLMPNGTKVEGLKAAGDIYNSDRARYPYQCWLNWSAISSGTASKGNILYNDEKFLTLLYENHEDRFENLSLVRDVGDQTMRNLSALLDGCKKCVVVVDCENSDAIKLSAALSTLNQEQLCKVSKVLLFDSEYTTAQWRTLVDRMLRISQTGKQSDASLGIEHIMVPRLNQSKSQVDMTLAVRTSKEVFANGADAVILVSSDSDYWAMIQQMDRVKFMVMLERKKTGLTIMDTLTLHRTPYCFLDDFCTSASYGIKTATLIDAIQQGIDDVLTATSSRVMNVRQMMEDAIRTSWVEMTEREKDAFFSRYLLHMKLEVLPDGMMHIRIGE